VTSPLPLLLLVDDSEAILEMEQAALSRHYRISLARNGAEALARVAQERPDGILLDLSMPDMDGDEVLARLQRDPRTASIPVLIVSSETERADACLERGALASLHKPVAAARLVSEVERVLEQVRAARRRQGLHILPLQVGPLVVALPPTWPARWSCTGSRWWWWTWPPASGWSPPPSSSPASWW